MNILLVDDDNEVVEVVELLMNRLLGMETIFFKAISALDAHDIVNEEDIDVIVTDIEMPEVNGYEFIQWLQEESMFEGFIFVLSSYVDESKIKGDVDIMYKPKGIVDICNKLNRIANGEESAGELQL